MQLGALFHAETTKVPCSFTTVHTVSCISDCSRKALKGGGNARRGSDFEEQVESCAGNFMAFSDYQGDLGHEGIFRQGLWSLLVQISTGTPSRGRSSLILVAIWIGGTIAGFVPGFFKPKDDTLRYMEVSGDLFYPYKTLPNGKGLLIAPWEVLLTLAILALIYYLVFLNSEMGIFLAMSLASGTIALLVVFLILKSSAPRFTARLAGTFWNKVCPPLVVLNEEESKS